jgi:phospho-2-dehydro-3-deoxyheptonate aldolase
MRASDTKRATFGFLDERSERVINDLGLDGSFQVGRGLRTARQLLLDLVRMHVPAANGWASRVVPR